MTNRVYRVFKMAFQLAYSCNMSCRGCLTISDEPRDGVENTQQAMLSMQEWSQVLDPDWITLNGGEPLMHPDIKLLAQQARLCWPRASICIMTNGLLLRKIMDRDWLESIKPVEIRVSLHRNDDSGRFFKPLLREFMDMYSGWQRDSTTFDGSHVTALWQDENHPHKFSHSINGVTVSVTQYERFTVPYKLEADGTKSPHGSDPAASWSHCVAPELPTLYRGRLWKCAPYANLNDAVPDFDQRWPAYQTLGSTDDLEEYFENIAKPHAICSMCPSSRDLQLGTAVDHLDPANVHILPSSRWMQKHTGW